jgi:hypothetical protein
MIWLQLVVWGLGTFLLHNWIHEGSHFLVLHHYGAVCKLSIWPGMVDGRWTWAHIDYDHAALTKAQWLLAWTAPVLAELSWLVLSLAVGISWHWAWLEVIPAAFDLGTWFLGLLTQHPKTDAMQALAVLK